ncbi:MAG: hypothetical protein KUG62_05045 [Rhodobacteraceae bacterium]|nr:hypothetical protein [Paracoccaceae bacterium]
MATKAQLLAELDLLKQQMASRDDISESQSDARNKTAEQAADSEDSDPKSYLSKLLEEQGIDKDEIDALWSQLTGELGDLTREKPLLTTAAAFGVGFVLGRISK